MAIAEDRYIQAQLNDFCTFQIVDTFNSVAYN